MFMSIILIAGIAISADLSQRKIMLASTIGPIDAGIVGALEEVPQVHHAEAMQFVNWLQGRDAQLIIRDFGKDKYGDPLFFPNSPEGKKL